MARQRLTYRERDLAAALKIIEKRGIKIGRIEVGKDGVSIILASEDDGEAEQDADEAERARIKQIIRDL